jgi:flavin-dependent dehydrogenase
MTDVIVIGAGPAGAVAATVLARAGARVLIIDRARCPRPKLCGDTINPGTLALLRRLDLGEGIERAGLAIEGMRVTGGSGVSVEGRYPRRLRGVALQRQDLDWMLLRQAIGAGAAFEPGLAVRGVHWGRPCTAIDGVMVPGAQGTRVLRAPVTIAADGRRSAITFGLGLARHPRAPKRWAIGAYVEGARTPGAIGEMHIRRGHYIGVAPIPGGVVNVCVVRAGPSPGDLRDPAASLVGAISADPMLRDRFEGARLMSVPSVLGPLAVDAVEGAAVPQGLLIAGDAAGFVDPMTGDGLRFAVRGGELAARAALRVLAHGWSGVHASLADTRHREFAAKQRFNRMLRALVASPRLVGVAAAGARIAPGALVALIAHAGDCAAAEPNSGRISREAGGEPLGTHGVPTR